MEVLDVWCPKQAKGSDGLLPPPGSAIPVKCVPPISVEVDDSDKKHATGISA